MPGLLAQQRRKRVGAAGVQFDIVNPTATTARVRMAAIATAIPHRAVAGNTLRRCTLRPSAPDLLFIIGVDRTFLGAADVPGCSVGETEGIALSRVDPRLFVFPPSGRAR